MFIVVVIYLWEQWKNSRIVDERIILVKHEGIFGHVSLHLVINGKNCMHTGTCISTCPKEDQSIKLGP